MTTNHTGLLNRLNNMISSPYYALRHDVLREAVRIILEQEEYINTWKKRESVMSDKKSGLYGWQLYAKQTMSNTTNQKGRSATSGEAICHKDAGRCGAGGYCAECPHKAPQAAKDQSVFDIMAQQVKEDLHPAVEIMRSQAPQAATTLPGGQALPEPRMTLSGDPRDKAHAAGWNACLEAVHDALTQQAAPEAPIATKAEIYTLRRLIECAEKLNERPRPMCRDCGDEDGACPHSGLECDMRKLFATAKALHNKLASPVAAPEAPASEQAQLVVGTSVAYSAVTVVVHMRRGDTTYVLYSKNHALNGDTMGVVDWPVEFATPAATTASTEMTAEQARAASPAMPLEAVVGMVKGATTASASGEPALTFAEFRRANVARCLKWHPAGIESWSPSDWLTAITGELGELASLLKMRNRERDGLPGNKFSPTQKQIADEVADVLTYLDLLAEVLGVDLASAAVEKFNEVSERVGFPDRLPNRRATAPSREAAPLPIEEERKHAEHEYTVTAFDYQRNPVGSRDWVLYWAGWSAKSKAVSAALAQQAAPEVPARIQALETGDDRESSHWFDITPFEVAMYIEEGYKIRYLYERASPVAAPEAPASEQQACAHCKRLPGDPEGVCDWIECPVGYVPPVATGSARPACYDKDAPCTCPSGDGSLRWPCPAHGCDATTVSASMHASIFVKVWGEAGGGDAGRIALANYAYELGKQARAPDERRNIAEVQRTSDMGLSIRFMSARACSAFERYLAGSK